MEIRRGDKKPSLSREEDWGNPKKKNESKRLVKNPT